MDDGLTTCTIFMDFTKAFNSVNHNILIQKLEHYGVRGMPLKLLPSYLHNRSKYMCIMITQNHQTQS